MRGILLPCQSLDHRAVRSSLLTATGGELRGGAVVVTTHTWSGIAVAVPTFTWLASRVVCGCADCWSGDSASRGVLNVSGKTPRKTGGDRIGGLSAISSSLCDL
ncbi:hypothetical protein O3P69_012110 [Scylla paramamosain]|uniref:Uncharacterized protein n=1 Tax=Scylla paramamosain TaxID=85552 RepID=A0AAW0TDY9_SCYPA